MVVRINEARLQITANRIGFAKAKRIQRYVYRHAVIGASGGLYSRTQALAASIETVGPFITGKEVTSFIFSALPYAASVERGAEIHNVFPKGMPHIYRFGSKRPKQLKFFWRGRIVYTPHVPMSPFTIGISHPGQKGKRFLRDALIKAAIHYKAKFIPGIGSF